MNITQTYTFHKKSKALDSEQKKDLLKAIEAIARTPKENAPRKGDLEGVRVYSFTLNGVKAQLAYLFEGKNVVLMVFK